jgi:hypothetical protein
VFHKHILLKISFVTIVFPKDYIPIKVETLKVRSSENCVKLLVSVRVELRLIHKHLGQGYCIMALIICVNNGGNSNRE